MKAKLPIILNVIMCVLLIGCFIKIEDLETKLNRNYNNIIGRVDDVSYSVNRITSNIERKLEEEASLLAASSWEYGKADFEDHTVTLHCKVTPKEYKPDETFAELVLNSGTYPMVLENGAFAADIVVPLVDESHVESVAFTEGDTIRTEKLDWYMNPRYDFLAQVYADFSGSVSGGIEDSAKNPEAQIYRITYDGEVNVNMEYKGNEDSMVSIRLVETIDGKKIADRELPPDKGVAVTDNGLEADPGAEVAVHGGPGYYYFTVKHSAEIPFGSVYVMYVEVEDSHGLCHRQTVYYESVDKEGEPVEDDRHHYYSYESALYDKAGNLLFGMDEELYR